MGSIVSGITSIFTGRKTAKAAKTATKQAVAGQNAAIGTVKDYGAQSIATLREALANERSIYDKAISFGQPYIDAGTRALTQYEDYLTGTTTGANGERVAMQDADQARMDALVKSPGYQFQFDEGSKALERSAAARSGMLSGAQSKAMTRFGQGLASTYYENFMSRLGGLATQGQNAAANAGSLSNASASRRAGALSDIATTQTGIGSDVGNLQVGIGNTKASGTMAKVSGINQAISGAGQVIGGVVDAVAGGMTGGSLGSIGAGVSSMIGGTGYGTGADVYNTVNNPANSGIF